MGVGVHVHVCESNSMCACTLYIHVLYLYYAQMGMFALANAKKVEAYLSHMIIIQRDKECCPLGCKFRSYWAPTWHVPVWLGEFGRLVPDYKAQIVGLLAHCDSVCVCVCARACARVCVCVCESVCV